MSLTRPHPIWIACGSNSFQSHKAVIACHMLSGRYLTDKLQRHWTNNREGTCLLPSCSTQTEGSLEHILLHCSALQCVRSKMFSLCYKVSQESEELSSILCTVIQSRDQQLLMQLILDCSVMPEVINSTQSGSTHTRDRLLYIGRTRCYSVYIGSG